MSGGDQTEFAGFVRRILRAAGRRYANEADVWDLAELEQLRAEVDSAQVRAVAGMRLQGFSWTEIGSALGVSRQAAQQRFAGKVALTLEASASAAAVDAQAVAGVAVARTA